MSGLANWSYSNVATVYPFMGYDGENNVNTYGQPYLIACTWIDEAKTEIDNDGNEFTAITTFYNEDARTKRGDYIVKGDTSTILDPIEADARLVRTVKQYDMSFFDEIPDYEVIT